MFHEISPEFLCHLLFGIAVRLAVRLEQRQTRHSTRISKPADNLQINDILIDTFESSILNDLGRCPILLTFDAAMPKFCKTKLYKARPKALSDALNLQLSFDASAAA